MTALDRSAIWSPLATSDGPIDIARLRTLEDCGLPALETLPYSIRILLENSLRRYGDGVTEQEIRSIAEWEPHGSAKEISFMPSRVLMQDFTGVPAFVELAAARDALVRAGKDPLTINPAVPVDLVIDHSVQVDAAGNAGALDLNARLEFLRNRERYAFLRWAQSSFANVRIVPPGMGIVHQVNLEYLADVVSVRKKGDRRIAMPDTVVGTDSHTTMINGLGVLGWGVGGIEAEAVLIGQSISMLLPRVTGLRLEGHLPEGATATDLVLTVTQMLREKGVVGQFVEFYGDALKDLALADRATIANMAPEYGATVGYFPVDDQTLAYLRQTGRTKAHVDLVERYAKEQGIFRHPDAKNPQYSDTLTLDLSTVEPCVAGPLNPSQRTALSHVHTDWSDVLRKEYKQNEPHSVTIDVDGEDVVLKDGDVVIAAITSCTNTSNPSVMIAAGLLAKKAVEKGLRVAPHIKTSLAPGSRVVTEYLKEAGLLSFLETLNFHVVGYGCTTCIGNSGPLHPAIASAIQKHKLVASSVLSGNRNFAGRVHSAVRANYLASPPLVVAYALAGNMGSDMLRAPLGEDAEGQPVFLRDIWPSSAEIQEVLQTVLTPEMFRKQYENVFEGDDAWKALAVPSGTLYPWDATNSYIQKPPFFATLQDGEPGIRNIHNARALLMLGDKITTDHISPAGDIAADSAAGVYLQSLGVRPADFNSYGSRRGNDRVMERGTFGNVRLKNALAQGSEGPVTVHFPDGVETSIFEAALRYKQEGTPTIIIAGKEYGSGSSRDWAAKGTMLLGVRAVLAESYERIHRSNLVGMGVLPLEFLPDHAHDTLALTGKEIFDVTGLSDTLTAGQQVMVRARDSESDTVTEFPMKVRIDNDTEIQYYRHGGILQMLLRKTIK